MFCPYSPDNKLDNLQSTSFDRLCIKPTSHEKFLHTIFPQKDIATKRYCDKKILRQKDIATKRYCDKKILRQKDIATNRYCGKKILRQKDILVPLISIGQGKLLTNHKSRYLMAP